MNRDGPEFSVALVRRLRDARRARGVSQSALAQAVGCRQSAISMMERGHGAALSRETLNRIAEYLEVPLLPPEAHAAQPLPATADAPGRSYCPNPDCPSNLPLVVGTGVVFWPLAQPHPGAYCGYCGEVREACCPNPDCRAPAVEAACCSRCGTPWVAAPPEAEADAWPWAERRRAQIAALRERVR